jgi:glucose-1-phosphate adenylyltransferase
VKDVTAIILGGGRGSRLYPLTLERSKPAVAFAGKYRLIDIPISNCINSDIKKIFVLTQFLSTSMHRHIMQTYAFDVFTDGFVDILAAEQTPNRESWFQGTSDAVRATLNHTMYYESEQFVILGGDHLYRMDYSEMVKFHRESGADITLGAYPVEREEASRMGLMRANDAGQVTEFVEKPEDPAVIDKFTAPPALFKKLGIDLTDDRYLASMGIYVFEPHVLKEVLKDTDKTDFGKEVIPDSINKFKVMAYPFNSYWRDIGTIASFFESNLEMVNKDPEFNLYEGGWPFYTRTRSLPPSRIIGSEIKDSLVVEGSSITGATIENSIIGIRGRVDEGTHLKDVIFMGSDFYDGEQRLDDAEQRGSNVPRMGIGKNCQLERCIIDKNVRIGDNVIIEAQPDVKEYQGDRRWIRDGITIIPKGTVIKSGSVFRAGADS